MKKKCDVCGLTYWQNNYLGRFRTAECPATNLLGKAQLSSVKQYYSEAMKKLLIPRIEAHGGVME